MPFGTWWSQLPQLATATSSRSLMVAKSLQSSTSAVRFQTDQKIKVVAWLKWIQFSVGIGAFANFLPEIGEIVGSRPKYGGQYKVEGQPVLVIFDHSILCFLGEQPKTVCRRLWQRQLCKHHQLSLWLLPSGQGGCQLWGLLTFYSAMY